MFNLKSQLATLLCCCSVTLTSVASDLTVNFEGIDFDEKAENNSTLYLVMFDSEDAYSDSGEPVVSRAVEVTADTLSVTIAELKNGTYAIKSFLDSNANQQLDTNLVGLPKEQYGFSNNAGRFGPASFEDAAFVVEGDNAISIRLR